MWSFYLQFRIYSILKWLFSGTYPVIYGYPRSFYMRIHYIGVYIWSPYLSHIMRSTCIVRHKFFFFLTIKFQVKNSSVNMSETFFT